jgi:hypothetical protein
MDNFKIFTYATDIRNDNFKKLSKNLDINILPILCNWSWDFYPKSFSVYETIKNLEEDCFILVCDAYDVLPLKDINNEDLYHKLTGNLDLNKITFNAEKNCYPDTSIINKYPQCNTPWKFLNAGVYFGKVGKIKNMLEIILPRIKNSDDQKQFSHCYVNREFDIALDTECKVFQTMYMLNPLDLSYKNNKITNNITKTEPILFHGNGNSDLSLIKNSL